MKSGRIGGFPSIPARFDSVLNAMTGSSDVPANSFTGCMREGVSERQPPQTAWRSFANPPFGRGQAARADGWRSLAAGPRFAWTAQIARRGRVPLSLSCINDQADPLFGADAPPGLHVDLRLSSLLRRMLDERDEPR